jgi:23S rRNA (adenine2503-C2)-methyltransferase
MSTSIPILARREMPLALSDLDLQGAESFALGHSLPRYRGRQIHEALSRGTVWDIADLTSLPGQLRGDLVRETRTRTLETRVHLTSKLDGSEKVLFGLRDGASIETVLIRSRGEGRDRETVCVSSQVGCPAACTFCATGLGGFTRNLTASEIVDQVMYFAHRLRSEGRHVTNVVFMGMGEPFLNPLAVRGTVERLTDPAGLGLGDRKITVSTVGIVPQIGKFAEWAGQVNLAVSLHAPNDNLRTQLVPYNARFPIGQLMEVLRDYVDRTHRRVSFEYVLLKNVNDALPLAGELAALLRPFGGLAHVNLIPWNPFREGHFIRSEGPDADAFAAELRRRGITTTIRYSKGLDISAACGQLREQVQAGRIA